MKELTSAIAKTSATSHTEKYTVGILNLSNDVLPTLVCACLRMSEWLVVSLALIKVKMDETQPVNSSGPEFTNGHHGISFVRAEDIISEKPRRLH